jgi:hypothetical protein
VPMLHDHTVSEVYLGCARGVLGMYQGCIRDVSCLYQGCTRDVSGMHQGCISGVGCFKDAPGMRAMRTQPRAYSKCFQECLACAHATQPYCVNGVSNSGCIRDVSGAYQWCVRHVPWMYQRFTRGVSGMYQGCLQGVPGMYQGCVRDVSGMYPACIRDVSRLHQGCIRGASLRGQKGKVLFGGRARDLIHPSAKSQACRRGVHKSCGTPLYR